MMIDRDELYKDLPFLSDPANVASYRDGKVFLLDRRVYPFEIRFEICETYRDVVRAIKDMVTQSGGPYHAVSCGMILAADESAGKPPEKQKEIMTDAARKLGMARPTNNSIRYLAENMLADALTAIEQGSDLHERMLRLMQKAYDDKYYDAYLLGKYASSLLSGGSGILTHCWPDICLVYAVRAALQEGKALRAFCSETRPYLQGARLTSKALADMGLETTVICDDMVAHVMNRGYVDALLTGTDRVTMDGWVFNKIGTLQAAICAKHFGIPYYPLCHKPDGQAKCWKDVKIEERDPEESLNCMGVRTAATEAKGLYPAFDATPPELVTAIVTGRGIYSPTAIGDYFR